MLNAHKQEQYVPVELTIVGNPTLEEYMADMEARLLPVVPRPLVDRFLEETLGHLEIAIESTVDHSISPEAATLNALDSYGTPKKVADEFIESWFSKKAEGSPIAQRFGMANAYAFGLFGCADLVYWILLQFRVFLPSNSPIQLPFSPAEIRKVFPEPLPFPDMSIQFLTVVGYPLLVPIILGWLCGWKIPIRSYSTVYLVLMPIMVSSYLIGALLLPATEGLIFAIVQTIYWLPVGCFMAYISSSVAAQVRKRRVRGTGQFRSPQRNH